MTGFKELIYAVNSSYSNGEVKSFINEHRKIGYLETLTKENDFINFEFDVPSDGYYKLEIRYSLPNENSLHRFFINDGCYGSLSFCAAKDFVFMEIKSLKLKGGLNKLTLIRQYGYINLDYIALQEDMSYAHKKADFLLSNINATEECKSLMKFFSNIYGKRILTGQHCNKASGTDFEYIKRVTGKTPAILGFDLLSYSAATKTDDSNFECIDEIVNNRGSVEVAIKLAKTSEAIITLCWHWFSPMNGKNKSFYTENTTFDLEKAFIEGTDENIAIIRDLDIIADQLKKFRDNNIPVLWRPLHEASGGWFWWGAHGSKAYIRLYRLMYDRYVRHHELNNLIWVWNSPNKDWYPGDDVVDINSNDYYAPYGNHGPLTVEFINTESIPNTLKPVALTENGPIPSPKVLEETGARWLWFMIWNNVVKEIEWNTKEELKEFFNHPYVINLEDMREIKYK